MANIIVIISGILLISCQAIQSTTTDDYEDDDCICVPLHRCKDLSDDMPIFDWRQFSDPENINPCGSLLQTCCLKENLLNSTAETVGGRQNGLVEETIRECGYTNPKGLSFSLQNMTYESQYAEFPWMIQILEKKQKNVFTKSIFEYSAGGSLIHPSFVLTGAHKVFNVSLENLKIRAGVWDKTSDNELYEHQERAVARIIINPRYSKLYNAIAILLLESPLVLDKHINTICIPPPYFKFQNDDCIVTGWGQDAVTKVTKNVLKKIVIPMVEKNECERLLRLTRLGPTFNRHPNWICAGGVKGEDACFGDGGSPLVCPMADGVDRYYQAGIVLGGIDCGNENVPGIYAEVSKFTRWINSTIVQNPTESLLQMIDL